MDKDGNYHMFLCKLVVGKYKEGDSWMKTPQLDPSNNVQYDTTGNAATKQEASILVAWFDNQGYPTYEIAYRPSYK